MSRTVKGSKGCDVEFWSKRPGKWYSSGPYGKRLTHRSERQQGKQEIRNELDWMPADIQRTVV